jgi:hypothetical protein
VVPDLVSVHRIYVTWDLDHRPVGEQVVAETEAWCTVCRTQYPHQLVDDPTTDDPAPDDSTPEDATP